MSKCSRDNCLECFKSESICIAIRSSSGELSVRIMGKVMSKDSNKPIKGIFNGLRNDHKSQKRYVSPFGLADLQLGIMKTCLFQYTENLTTKKWKFSDEIS